MVRKLDFRILPVLSAIYLFNALDKGNLGNAQTDGMDKDIGLVGNQYCGLHGRGGITDPRPRYHTLLRSPVLIRHAAFYA